MFYNNIQDDYIFPLLDLVNNLNEFKKVTNYPFDDAEYEDYPAFVLDEVWDDVISKDESLEMNIVARRCKCYVLDTLTEGRDNLDSQWRNVERLSKLVNVQIMSEINFSIQLERRIYRRFVIGGREVVAAELVFLTKFSEAIDEAEKVI
jgi:hypothetical protein